MKDDEWNKLKRPYEILPHHYIHEEYAWHKFECDKCGEILGFQEYPNDGDQYCVECGLKEKHVRY